MYNNIKNVSKLLNDTKKFLCVKDEYKEKYRFLINKRKSVGLKHFKDSKTFIEY